MVPRPRTALSIMFISGTKENWRKDGYCRDGDICRCRHDDKKPSKEQDASRAMFEDTRVKESPRFSRARGSDVSDVSHDSYDEGFIGNLPEPCASVNRGEPSKFQKTPGRPSFHGSSGLFGSIVDPPRSTPPPSFPGSSFMYASIKENMDNQPSKSRYVVERRKLSRS